MDADGMKRRGIQITILLVFCFMLIPLSISCIPTSGAAYIKEVGFEEHQQLLAVSNPVLTAGNFYYLDVTLTNDAHKISIVAYLGSEVPDVENRSIKNYYRWEYNNGVWIDASGHDSSFIVPSKCTKENNTYSFCIRLSDNANPGSWSIKIFVDNKEASSSSVNVIMGDFCLFFSTIIGVFEPSIKGRNSLVENELICCYQQRKMLVSEGNIDKIVDEIIRKKVDSSKEEKTVNSHLDFSFSNGAPLTKNEQLKSTVVTYPRSKLKDIKNNMVGSLFFKKVWGEENGFYRIKLDKCQKFFVVLSIIILFLSSIAPAVIGPSISEMIVTTELCVWDDTDFQKRYVNETITFYANYTSFNQSIENAKCLISFTDKGWTEPVLMNYSGELYFYSRFFNTSGIYEYQVLCSAAAFENETMVGWCDVCRNEEVNESAEDEAEGNTSFLVKPTPPTDFYAVASNQSCINLSWIKGTGANNTYIVRRVGSYPANRTNGVFVYNGTGTNYLDEGLNQSTQYYYSAWSYAQKIENGTLYSQWSEEYVCVTNTTANPPITIRDDDLLDKEIDDYSSIDLSTMNYPETWSYILRHTTWNLQAYIDNQWQNVSGLAIEYSSLTKEFKKFSLNFIAGVNATADYRLVLTIDIPVDDHSFDASKKTFLLKYTILGQQFNFEYNYSDIGSIPELIFNYGKDNNNRFWFSIQKNDVPYGVHIELDPTYGLIADAVTNSWEYDPDEGRYPDMIRLGASEYYAIVSTGDEGTELDGYIRTIKVWNSNGTIRRSLVDSLEYDTSDGIAPSICLVSGDMYAISYYNDTGNKQTIKTVSIDDADGQIAAAVTDTQQLTYDSLTAASRSKILKMSGDLFAVVYSASDSDLWIQTINITAAGDISAVVAGSQEINTTDGIYPDMCLVDSDTMAVVYTGGGSDGYLSTWNISSTGTITATRSAEWEFDPTLCGTPTIAKVTGNMFMIAYKNNNADLYVYTTTIADTGAITKSWADTLLIDATLGDYPTFFNVSVNGTVANQWIKGISFSDSGVWISTFDVTGAGIIGSEIDTLTFGADTVAWYIPTCFVSGFYFLSIYVDASLDGWAKTFQIYYANNPPTISNPIPANGTTGVSTTPQLSVNVSDIGDILFANWTSNSSGSWQKFDTNQSIYSYGAISNSNVSWWEYDAQEGLYPDVIRLGTSDYYAVVSTGDTGTQGFGYIRVIKAWNTNGTIKRLLVSNYKYDGSDGDYPRIQHVSGDIYAIAYYDDTANKLSVITKEIRSSDGNCTVGNIDRINMTYDTQVLPLDFIRITGNVFAVAYTRFTTNGGWFETMTINNDGTIDDALLDSEQFDEAYGLHPRMCMIDSDTVAIVSYDINSDGYLNTYNVSAGGIITDAEKSTYGGTIQALVNDSTYIYVAGATTNKIYQYWKSNMTKKAETITYGGIIYALTQDDTYIYAGGATTLRVRQYWKSNMTYKTQTASYGYAIYALASDDTYIYAGGLTTNKVSQYWKSNMTRKVNTTSYGGTIWALAQDDTYIYAAGTNSTTAANTRVKQYWKSNMTKKAETATYGGIIYALTQDSTYIYVAGATTLKVYQYWKSNMTKKAETLTYGGIIYALTQDDTYIYAGGATTLRVYQYLKTDMSYVAQTESYVGQINALTEDSTYIYAGGATTLKVYRYWRFNMAKTGYTASWWEFDSGTGTMADIKRVYGNVFAIAYEGTDTDGWIKTVTIADTGAITKSWIDILEFDIADGGFQRILPLGNNLFVITYQGPGTDGWMKTLYISNTGAFADFEYDALEFDTTDTVGYANIVSMGNDYYFIAWPGFGNDGWSCTVKIGNDTTTTLRQTNANFSAVGTTYYWRVNVSDGANQNYSIYSFTTETPAAANNAPTINSYDLLNSTGSKLNSNTGLLDVNNEYYFQINITDEDGWADIQYINLTAWYDNGTESTTYNNSGNLGGNLNMFLQYENTTGTANYTMLWPDDEAELISGNCSETIINSTTRVVNISFKPKSQVRYANTTGGWDTTQNATNDPNSWNFNITIVDNSSAKAWKIDEYGVYKYTFIEPNQNWVGVTAIPGENDTSDVVAVTYSSNYDFNMTIWFEENLANQAMGTTIPIANNVDILNDTDPNDDIDTGDITFNGIGEVNAVDIFNTSGIFSKNNVSQTVNVQFNVRIPLGTMWGEYIAHIGVKIIQKT